MDGPTHVEWHEWGEEAFEVAARERKPVLLSLVVTWAAECHEMEATTYAEPRVAANVNDAFVPVRVDADRQPQVRERYNMGGFPSTVFLTPAGKVLTGATLLGVDGFREILEGVRRRWDESGEAAGSVPRALRERPPGGELGPRVEEHMIEQLLATFDDEFGGWGAEVKFPLPRTVEFALVRAREQALRTLDAVHTHLLDTYDGGFYRFSRNRDWSGARREKLADENAALVRAFAHGYRYTGEERYREAAERGIDVLTTTLWTGDAVAASQGGDESYFRLEPTEREDAEAPAVDQTVLAGHNGLAIDALLCYCAYTDDERARRRARQAREFVTEELVDSAGCVTRYREEGSDGPQGLLVDQARLLRALCTSWSVLGEPGPAVAVADWTLEHLGDDGLRDGPGGAGLVDQPLYPLDTTVELADALVDLALLTGEERYRERASDALAAFAGATSRMGVEVAGYATAVARVCEPRLVAVDTPAGTDLHRAALRLADHETVVVPRDGSTGEARLLVDGTDHGRAETPAELEALLTGPSG